MDMCITIRIDMFTDMCIDMCIDMIRDLEDVRDDSTEGVSLALHHLEEQLVQHDRCAVVYQRLTYL